jgi:Icc-related predicted phosphoesterase
MSTEAEMWWSIGRLAPALARSRLRHGRALDILITHAPPFAIHDAGDPAHQGFRAFRAAMALFRPRYLLHGHVHQYRRDAPRITRYRDTTVINVYPWAQIAVGT